MGGGGGGRGGEASVGEKVCPRSAARTLYEFGRIKNGGLPFVTGFSIPQLWKNKLGGKNGTYAILTTRLLREKPHLSEDLDSLWREIRQAVKREVDYDAPKRDEGAMEVAYQLWRCGHIVDTDGA